MPPAMTNPSVELAVACRSLRKLEMAFHFKKLSRWDDRFDRRVPLSVDTVLDHFKFRPLLKCENLQDVFLDGIQGLPARGGQPSDVATLIELGKWLVKGFMIEQERKIRVEVGIRWGARLGRGFGQVVTLGEREKNGVNRRLATKIGQ